MTATQPPVPTTTMVTTTRVDAAAVLGDAIVETGDRYRFSSTVDAGDDHLAAIEGTVSGTSFDALIDAGDVPVEYRKTNDGEWVRQGDGDWAALETGPAPASDPLATLAAPRAADVVSDDGSTVMVDAVFDGVDLGASAQEVTVRVTVTNGVVRSIEYTTMLGERTVTIATAISDVGAVEPIPSP